MINQNCPRASHRIRPAAAALALAGALSALSCTDDLAVDPAGGLSAILETVAWPDTVLVGESRTLTVRGMDSEGREIAGLEIESTSSDTTVLKVETGKVGEQARALARWPGAARVRVRLAQHPFAPVEVEGDVVVALAGLRTAPSATDTTTLSALADTVILRASGLDAAGEVVRSAGLLWAAPEGALVEVIPFADGDSARVIARAAGETTVLVTHPLCRGACEEALPVRVRQAAGEITVTASADTLTALGDTLRLSATVVDRNGSPVAGVADSDLSWSSLDPAVVEMVAPGKGVARGNGKARLVAAAGKDAGAAADTVEIVVAQRPHTITVTPAAATLTAIGAEAALTASIVDANDQPVTSATPSWSSLDPSVATVDANTGLVAAVLNGTARIVATSGAAADTVVVEVSQVPARIELSSIDTVFFTSPEPGDELLNIAVSVSDARGHQIMDETVSWSSTNRDVAATISPTSSSTHQSVVSGNGYLGTATLTAAAANGVTAQARVTVAGTLDGISPADTTISALDQYMIYRVQASDFLGGTSTVPNHLLAWTSSNTGVAMVSTGGSFILSRGNGTATITATTPDGQSSVQATVRVQQVPTGHSAPWIGHYPRNAWPNSAVIFTVHDASSRGVPGVEVRWEVVEGDGTLSYPITWTSNNGYFDGEAENLILYNSSTGPSRYVVRVTVVGAPFGPFDIVVDATGQ